MEKLLQLHVVIPEEVPDGLDSEIMGGFDAVIDLLMDYFPVPNEGPTYDHLGVTVSSSLFERRPDNMEDVAEIERQLEEWYPNASVYRSSYDQVFGEIRTPADPSVHIVLLVTNWSVEEPSIRWKREKETLQAPPLVLDDEIFQGNKDGIYAIDSGEVRDARTIQPAVLRAHADRSVSIRSRCRRFATAPETPAIPSSIDSILDSSL